MGRTASISIYTGWAITAVTAAEDIYEKRPYSEAQDLPEASHVTGLAECAWEIPVGSNPTWTVPGASRWSGAYLAKITANVGQKQSYIIFVVRDDNRVSDYIFQTSVTTYQAYNFWPANLPPPARPNGTGFGEKPVRGGGAIPVKLGPGGTGRWHRGRPDPGPKVSLTGPTTRTTAFTAPRGNSSFAGSTIC